jgi:hypothetical protein
MNDTPITSEAASLVAALRGWGIDYLTSDGSLMPESTIPPVELLHRLAQSPQARIRDATIALLLLHPELAGVMLTALASADQETREQLTTLVLAALYLQRIWLTQLTLALGKPPRFPEAPFAALWEARCLPPPALNYGEPGLRALEAAEQQRRSVRYCFSGDWQNQAQHLMLQHWARPSCSAVSQTADIGKRERSRRSHLRQRVAGATRSPTLPTPQSPWQAFTREEGGAFMSLRPPVDGAAIERFLQRLGNIARHSGRVYLVGGAALVHHQVRPPHTTTLDIDLALEVSDISEVEAAIQRLKQELNLTVELASPGDFIPLPASWQRQSHYVGRYGPLEVFYFDYYSLALSKIERGTERDLQDVELLARQGWIAREQLDAAYREILPQMGHGRYFNRDAARFAAQYAAAVQRAWAEPPEESGP